MVPKKAEQKDLVMAAALEQWMAGKKGIQLVCRLVDLSVDAMAVQKVNSMEEKLAEKKDDVMVAKSG